MGDKLFFVGVPLSSNILLSDYNTEEIRRGSVQYSYIGSTQGDTDYTSRSGGRYRIIPVDRIIPVEVEVEL